MPEGPDRGPRGTSAPGEVYFEHVQIGAYVKVSAIDANSGMEVSIMGPRTAGQHDLEQGALRKLRAQMAKRGA